MPAEVFYHSDFRNSDSQSKFFKDYLALDINEIGLLSDFISEVEFGSELRGRNKPSWYDSNDKEILSHKLKYYKTCELWHYHLGPFTLTPSRFKTKIRIINIEGDTSSAIVHYKWFNSEKKTLIILAFSPVHNPFPIPADKNNPLKLRSGLLKKSQMIRPF